MYYFWQPEMNLDLENGLSAELRDNEIRAVGFGTISVKLQLIYSSYVLRMYFHPKYDFDTFQFQKKQLVWTNLTNFRQFWASLDKFGQVRTN